MEQVCLPAAPYTLPSNEQGYRTNHTCELCGYEPKTKNKYREKQDHLVMKHFKEQVERDFSRSHNPYLCPTDGCGFEAKDKQGLLRHYTGKHRVIEAYLAQALAAKGVVVVPQAGVKRRRSSGTSETSNHSGTSDTSGDMGTADQDKKAQPVYPGYQAKIQGYSAPAVGAQGYGAPGMGVQGYGAQGGNRSYAPHSGAGGGMGEAGRRSGYQAAGGEAGRYRMVQGAGYLLPGGVYLGGRAAQGGLDLGGRAPPAAHQAQAHHGGQYSQVQTGGYQDQRYRRPAPPQTTLPDPVKIKKEVEAMMASFGLRAFGDQPVASSATPTPHQQYASPSPQEYASPSPQEYATPSPQEYVSPSPQPQQYVQPPRESPQEYVSPSPQYVRPPQESPQDYVTPSPQEYVTPSPEEYVSPSPQEYVNPPQQYIHPPQDSPQEQYVHPPQISPQEYVPPASQGHAIPIPDEYTQRPPTSPYPPNGASIPSPYVTTSPITPPDSQPKTPESSSSSDPDPLEPPTITPKLEPEWS